MDRQRELRDSIHESGGRGQRGICSPRSREEEGRGDSSGVRPLSAQVPQEEQSGRALEEAQAQVSRLPEDFQASPLPGLPRGEDPSTPGVRLQRMRVQEQQQRYPEEPLHPSAHEQLRFLLRHVRQAIQDKESVEPSREAEPQRRTSDSVRRVRPLQQESPRFEGPHEVQALQARVRMSNLQKRDDHPGESGATFDLARDQGEGVVPHLRKEVQRPGSGLSHEGAHRGETVPLPRVRQIVQKADCSGAARAHPHGEEAVRLRHLRPGFRSETRLDLSQETPSWTLAPFACRFDKEHRHRVH